MKFLLAFVVLLGLSFAKADRIVNGTEAVQGQVNFIVRLNSVDFNYCDGSIYTEEWIISAGHCLQSSLAGQNVMAGELNRLDTTGLEQRVSMKGEFRHCDYSSVTMHNDIMLIKLDEPLVLTPGSVETIPLATAELPNNHPVMVAGWGTTEYGGETSDDLMVVTVYTISTATCVNQYSAFRIDDRSLCLEDDYKDSCQGDSGGPAYTGEVVNGVTENAELVGIVSWGQGCAEPGYAGVYAKVMYYVDWVEQSVAFMDDMYANGAVSDFGCVTASGDGFQSV